MSRNLLPSPTYPDYVPGRLAQLSDALLVAKSRADEQVGLEELKPAWKAANHTNDGYRDWAGQMYSLAVAAKEGTS